LGEIDTSYLSTKVVIKVFSYFSFKIIFFVKKTNLILKALIDKIQLELSTYVNWSNPREFQANLVILWQLLSLIGLTQIANVQLLRWHNNSCKKLNKNCEFFFHNFFFVNEIIFKQHARASLSNAGSRCTIKVRQTRISRVNPIKIQS